MKCLIVFLWIRFLWWKSQFHSKVHQWTKPINSKQAHLSIRGFQFRTSTFKSLAINKMISNNTWKMPLIAKRVTEHLFISKSTLTRSIKVFYRVLKIFCSFIALRLNHIKIRRNTLLKKWRTKRHFLKMMTHVWLKPREFWKKASVIRWSLKLRLLEIGR